MSENEAAIRQLSTTAIRNLLSAASGRQMSPNPLRAGMREAVKAAGHTLTSEVVCWIELALWRMVRDGEIVWTKEGPFKLLSA